MLADVKVNGGNPKSLQAQLYGAMQSPNANWNTQGNLEAIRSALVQRHIPITKEDVLFSEKEAKGKTAVLLDTRTGKVSYYTEMDGIPLGSFPNISVPHRTENSFGSPPHEQESLPMKKEEIKK